VSFAILKIFWLSLGPHFYLEHHHADAHTAPIYFDVVAICFLIVCGVMLSAGSLISLNAIIVFCLITFEYSFYHHDHHNIWQVALIIWLLTSLALTAAADIAFIASKKLATLSSRKERFDI
jgi:threonine/homoserine/homoserine lactone efflux protein